MKDEYERDWRFVLNDPQKGRLTGPGNEGLTMVLDKGLGLSALKDLLDVSGQYIDFIKLSFGTSLLYVQDVLEKKIEIIKEYQIDVYPGGTLFEIAVTQNKLDGYMKRAYKLGFTALEISNGTISLSETVRREAILKAKKMGFKVLTEVGKKDKNNPLQLDEMQQQINRDLETGADNIIVEGRESGRGVSIYCEDGSIDFKMLNGILLSIKGFEDVIIWEAPLKKQQVLLIKQLGPNVNLGNIAVDEVLALESLRRGLRGDTFKLILESEIDGKNVNKESGVGA
ncbi:MAG: phosphosulfolactate synthase [Halanaerobiaceae bacterium]